MPNALTQASLTTYKRLTLFLELMFYFNTSQNYAGFSQHHDYIAFFKNEYSAMPPTSKGYEEVWYEKCLSGCRAHRPPPRHGDSGYSWCCKPERQWRMEGNKYVCSECTVEHDRYRTGKHLRALCKTTRYMKTGVYWTSAWLGIC